MFEDLEDDVQFNRDQILTEDTTRSLEDYVDAGLQDINYTSYIVQTRSIISTLNVSKLIEMLEGVRNEFDVSNQVSDKSLTLWIFNSVLSCQLHIRLYPSLFSLH